MLKNQITVRDYFELMQHLLLDIEETRREGVQIDLRISRMSIRDGKVQRELLQQDGISEMVEVRDFLKLVTFECIFELNEDCSAVTKFLQMMDSVAEINFFGVMTRFCETQLGTAEQEAPNAYRAQTGRTAAAQQMPQPVPQSYQGNFNAGVAPQAYQGNANVGMAPQSYQGGNDGETGVLSDDFWLRFENQNAPSAPSPSPAGMGNVGRYEPAGAGGETGVLDPNFWQKISQGNQGAGAQRPVNGRLVHAKTGNVFVINKENFWIGSKGDVDLKIEKETVSRRHAQILVRQNHYFISDNDSTNKTYVDGKEITPKASVELFNGMRVKFANEEYIFQL